MRARNRLPPEGPHVGSARQCPTAAGGIMLAAGKWAQILLSQVTFAVETPDRDEMGLGL